jgi:hypothetical protein
MSVPADASAPARSAAPSPVTAADVPSSPATSAVLVGAGDIASCGSEGDEATARLLDHIDGTVFTVGDNAYPDGTAEDFRRCYQPSWGRHLARTLPAPGNHDHHTAAAAAYHAYFGSRAGQADRSWYSTELGAWHVIVLDSECKAVGGCDPSSSQGRWLAADLASNPVSCTLIIWHRPRFSSGDHRSDRSVDPFWKAAYAAGVDLIVNGHDHHYERFAPQDPTGLADDARGIRQIVVGTGGARFGRIGRAVANSEIRVGSSFGVLRLTLRADDYDWEFIPVQLGSFRDAGTGACH